MKTALTIVIIVVMAASLVGNIYNFAYPWAFNRGVNACMSRVTQSYLADGKLTLFLEGKKVVLVPEAVPK